MSLALTLLQRDLMHWPRRRGFYLKRLVFVGICALIVLWAFGIAAISGSTTMGLQLFHSLSATVLFCACVFSGTTSGLNLMREKRERTLGLLFMTDISIPEQVVGKTMTGAFVIVTTLLSTFPMFVLCATLGGVSPAQIAAAFVILLGTVTVGSCAGISAAASASTERALIGRVLALVALVFAALPMAVFVFGGRNSAIVSLVLPIVSPFIALNHVGDGSRLSSGYWNCGFNLLLGLPFVFAAMRALPREFDPKPNPLLAWMQRSRTRAGHAPNRASVAFNTRNPVLTKDVHCVCRGHRREWVVASTITAVIIAVVSVTTAWINVATLSEALAAAGIGAAVVCAFTSGIFAIIRSARSFNSEKEDRTLELLVMSDLTERQIIWGKLGAIAVSVLPWLVIGCVGGALFT
ncbi:MAG: ABC-type Na+ efflux pump permease subunit, partial [Candidatus Promineifilaceae bacterium]